MSRSKKKSLEDVPSSQVTDGCHSVPTNAAALLPSLITTSGNRASELTQKQKKKKVAPSVIRAAAALSSTTSSNGNQNDEEGQECSSIIDIGACCLCHCALDYSDRAAFFKEDRHQDYSDNDDDNDKDDSSYYFRAKDPYLPVELYDKNNALVYCDECDRMYHQKCHFVPLTVLPKRKWTCLFCISLKQQFQQKNNKQKPNQNQKQPKQSSTKNSKKGKRGKPKEQERKDDNDNDALEQEQKEWFQVILPNSNIMFRSPPHPEARPLEQKWESAVRQLKAATWQAELTHRLKQAVSSQATNYRLAEMAAITLTSTRRNRSHFSSAGGSQELAQTLVRMYGARLAWRELCFHLDSIRRNTNESWHALHKFVVDHCCQDDNKRGFVERVLFPFGRQHPRRVEPRTPEMTQVLLEQNKSHAIPQEILVSHQHYNKKNKQTANSTATPNNHLNGHPQKMFKKTTAGPPNKRKLFPKMPGDDKFHDGDGDDGISLDNLQCCICHTSDATDENDLIMCDSGGCYRAYHYQCLQPPLTCQNISEADDWFCPICSALAETMLAIQVEWLGDDWEEERLQLQLSGKPCDGSHKSWDRPEEVFVTAEKDYAAALQMKQGKRNKQTDDLLARVLGLEQLDDHDSDDEQEDGHWDLNSFEERRKQEYAEAAKKKAKCKKQNNNHDDEDNVDDSDSCGGDDGDEEEEDDSSHSSQATLVDMDCVELTVGKGELDALSKGSSSHDDDEDNDGNCDDKDNNRPGPIRRSRRLVNHQKSHGNKWNINEAVAGCRASGGIDHDIGKNSLLVQDLGQFDKANILEGKRGRKPVDYIQLNEAIFGNISEMERANLDDADDFQENKNKNGRKNKRSSPKSHLSNLEKEGNGTNDSSIGDEGNENPAGSKSDFKRKQQDGKDNDDKFASKKQHKPVDDNLSPEVCGKLKNAAKMKRIPTTRNGITSESKKRKNPALDGNDNGTEEMPNAKKQNVATAALT